MKRRRRVLSPHTPYQNRARPVKEVIEIPKSLSLPAAKKLAWLLPQCPNDLSAEDALMFTYVLQDEKVVLMRERPIRFRPIVREQQFDTFDVWLTAILA